MNNNRLDKRNYENLIYALKSKNYIFCKFSVLPKASSLTPYVLLRHDVDFSLQAALELASFEHQVNVQSTYFVHLRSEIYNPISYDGIKLISEISSLGHDIALHVTYQDDLNDLSAEVVKQIEILKKYCSYLNSGIVSFHRPGIKAKELLDYSLPKGTLHTYQKRFFLDTSYYSDSGGSWKYGNPIESDDYKNKKNMQILIHPFWWLEEGDTPLQKLSSYLSRNPSITADLIQKSVISYPINSIQEARRALLEPKL